MANKKKVIKKSRDDRLVEENRGIIEKDPKNKDYFICKVCQNAGSLHYSGLWNNCSSHISSRGHQKNLYEEESDDGTQEGSTSHISEESKGEEYNNQEIPRIITESIKNGLDLVFTKFILQYRLPFSIVKPLYQFITEVSSEYHIELMEQYSIPSTIVTKVSKSISTTLKNELYDELRSSPFSLSLDSSSDIHGNTYMAVCVKYLDKENQKSYIEVILYIANHDFVHWGNYI